MNKAGTDVPPQTYFPLGFHLSRKAWEQYSIAELLRQRHAGPGRPEVYALRGLADRLNARHDFRTYAAEPVHAGQLVSFGVVTDILRYLADRYCLDDYPGALMNGLEATRQRRGATAVETPLHAFVALFPPPDVCEGKQTPAEYIDADADPPPHRHMASRELLLLHITTENPAALPLTDLFDDSDLKRRAPYDPLVSFLEDFFKTQPPFPGAEHPLIEFLRTPMRACPHSFDGQIGYILEHWRHLLPASLLERLRLAADVLKEEARLRGHGPGPLEPLRFGPDYLLEQGYPEPAHFTADQDWMSNVVLIAKSVYVWLDQLSKKYQRPITRLDHVPDQEIDRLARWGFTGLWMIGLWERSPASREIKRMMGNPDALASAYSLFDYAVAADLGGQPAYEDLRDRAWRRGIRLASDMVPNHVGLNSPWLIEHPDWFIQLDYPPFPSYRFTGEDLSSDSRVTIQIEDGYWEHRDAAVVFKWVDNHTGETRYIYHGNDGTNMPWNDTAQLNFLVPEVREAVANAILGVARKFPILRFDAAMTLTKRHYHRLWFPKPGDAGAIPSRAEHGLSRADFDQAFPQEFWREVVDRVQAEAPDTLLVAEAFWLMEGYFVRTLGMHRVYNSAFMNMLKMEDNAMYRTTVRNVLEFSPEVLKRFVNFMNNPDERTAIDQFGKDDKYYGVAVLMVTMPGLPMFGHGQIEGFTEKYGMEYPRAYWDEAVDEEMVRRHETEIFPLMRKRRLFSGVDHFAFYDFVTTDGAVDENVFAFSNRAGDQRAVVLYNNAYNTTRGAAHLSVAYNVGDGDHKDLRRVTLGEALGLDTTADCYYVFRDHKTGLEYVRSGGELSRDGLALELRAYQYHAFLDFREIHDADGTWARLAGSLGGRGVPSMDEAHHDLVLEPLHRAFAEIMNGETIRALVGATAPQVAAGLEARTLEFVEAVNAHTSLELEAQRVVELTLEELDALQRFEQCVSSARPEKHVKRFLLGPVPDDPAQRLAFWRIPIALALAHQTGKILAEGDYSLHAVADVDKWFLTKTVRAAFLELDDDESAAEADALLARTLAAFPTALDFFQSGAGALTWRRIFQDTAARRFLLVNPHEGTLWFNKERSEKLVYWLLFEAVVALMLDAPLAREDLKSRYDNAQQVLGAVHRSGYRVDRFFELLASPAEQ